MKTGAANLRNPEGVGEFSNSAACAQKTGRSFLGAFWACACLALGGFSQCLGQAPEAAYSFHIGRMADQGAAAQVAVEEVVRPEKKRQLFKLPKAALPIVRGISVRFDRIQAAALDEIPAAIHALAKTTRVQMQRVAFFAPGDPVPRLMAEEAVVHSRGEWILKGVLLADRPSIPECRLVWNKGEARLAFARGNAIELNELLAAREVQ